MKRTFSDVGEMQYPTHLILLVACSRILGPPVRPDRGGGYAAVFQDLEGVCLVYVRAGRSIEIVNVPFRSSLPASTHTSCTSA